MPTRATRVPYFCHLNSSIVSGGAGGGCAGGGVPLGTVLALSWCGEVSLLA